MKRIARWFILVIGVLLVGSCLNILFTKKSFYTWGSGWDYVRFPLLEPYFALNIIGDNNWVIDLHAEPSQTNFWLYSQIKDVRKIAVENGAIMVYSEYSEPIEVKPEGQRKVLHWFILIPNKTETGYETEETFNLGLQQYGLSQPKWQEPLSILQKFDQTGCLDWIPDCK